MLQTRATRVALGTQPIIIVHHTIIVASRTSHCARKHHLRKAHVRACKTYIINYLCACIITLVLAKLSTSLSRYPSRGKSTGSNAPRFDTAGSDPVQTVGEKWLLGRNLNRRSSSFTLAVAGVKRKRTWKLTSLEIPWWGVMRSHWRQLLGRPPRPAGPARGGAAGILSRGHLHTHMHPNRPQRGIKHNTLLYPSAW